MLTRLVREARIALQRVRGEPVFRCPICGYRGAFRTHSPPTGARRWALCPGCGALERHRLQWASVGPLLADSMRVLHVAPEPFIGSLIRERVASYVAGDLEMADVDCRADLTRMPFRDGSFDLVWASHVLEHVRDDDAALAEISRVLCPGGIAVLPVPVVGPETIEYTDANPVEWNHVRSPGLDYFSRYRKHFSAVRVTSSADAPPEVQPYIYQDWSRWSYATLRRPVLGERHEDYVPICTR